MFSNYLNVKLHFDLGTSKGRNLWQANIIKYNCVLCKLCAKSVYFLNIVKAKEA